MIVTDKLSTESFHAFIDEQLTDEQYVQVEAQLDEIPEKIEEIQQCHIINERLREVFDPIVEELIPDDLYELGLYGLEHDQPDQEAEGYDEAVSYLELEEDLAAIDSLDIFPDSEEQSFIDDNDAADLELLAQTEHLSGFDIDNLRNDPENIIPDIFDGADAQSYDAELSEPSEGLDPTDDLLESIDTLSVELEKAHQNKQAQKQAEVSIQEPAHTLDQEPEETLDEAPRNLLNEIDTDSLELEPLEDEDNSDLLDESQLLQDEHEYEQEEQQSAKENVLEKLEAEEELTLEPLESHSTDAFIQDLALSVEEETRQQNEQQNKPVRPRNIREDQVVKEKGSPLEFNDAVAGSALTDGEKFDFEINTNKKRASSGNDDSLPEDLVAEFFSESKGADFEVNEVVKQFEEVSENFGDMDDGHLFDEGPFANIKYKAQEIVNVTTSRINDIKTVLFRKKTEIIGKFSGGRSDIDFDKAPIADFSAPQSSPDIDTLDLSAFDDFTDEPKSNSPANSFVEKKKDREDQINKEVEVKDSLEPDKNVAMDSAIDNSASLSEQDIFPDFENHAAVSATSAKRQDTSKPEAAASATPDFNMDFGIEDGPDENNLVNKFGDTLRRYKQKIAEMRANTLDDSGDLGEQASGIDKYKNIFASVFGNSEFASNSKVLTAVILVAALFVGGVVVFLNGGSAVSINNDRIEKLAIDAHLLNTQFNAKITADADSAIIEKLQWFSARVGRQVRLADIRIEDFEFKNVSVMPTMASFAATNIFENKAGQRITLMAIADLEGVPEVAISCRIPPEVDGLCSWVKGSVRYIAVANLSLSRVRSFSQQVIDNL